MAVCPENIDEWLLNVPNLLEDEGWQLGHESPAGKLWKQSCPWGGHLVRLSCENLPVNNLGTCPLFVRPDPRSRFLQDHPELNEEGFKVVQPLGSGEATVMNNAFSRFFKLCNVFFSLHRKEEDDSLSFHTFPQKRNLCTTRFGTTIRRWATVSWSPEVIRSPSLASLMAVGRRSQALCRFP
ncbi:unnamed protein product [Symbiodinium necroappetens]|uniref:Uncharacterized protein n=1 Tax=Symbiodinium necroappetens TaxID=1628268 RepID=A0A812L9R0_9DINO|nr:unnamed protein product [Symbiodinium necroappetens]